MTTRRNRIHVYEATDGFRWRLRATNGRIVADSGEAYSTRHKAVRAANALASYVADAIVTIDHTPVRKWETL